MSKKKNKIRVYTNADKNTYKLAYATGGFMASDAVNLGSNVRRLKSHIKDGYIAIDCEVKQRGQPPEYKYVLTKKGLNKCREINEVGYAYKRAGERHDRALRAEFIEAHKNLNIVEWRTEKDWERLLDDKIDSLKKSISIDDQIRGIELDDMRRDGKISPPDGGYVTTSGEVVAIEIITRNYKGHEVDAKHEFVRLMGCEYKEIDIN